MKRKEKDNPKLNNKEELKKIREEIKNVTQEDDQEIEISQNETEKNQKQIKNKAKNKNNNKNKEKDTENIKWFIKVFISTFILSIVFSYISANGVSNLGLIPAIFILLLVIGIGIVFDIIGVAVTVANEEEFHAKATKKVKGSKSSIKLIRNAPKVANICADVIGDICGVLSGAISALIAVKVTEQFNLSFDIQFLISALVAAVTVGSKAFGKMIANKSSTKVVHATAIVLNKFKLKKQ